MADDSRRSLRWDGTITAGNLLTAIAMMAALAAAYYDLRQSIAMEIRERERLEMEITRKGASDDIREREAFAEVRAGLRRIEDILLRRTASER
jgi:hypothetical protein